MSSLRTLAKEVRQQIFELCLTMHPVSETYHKDTSYKTPALLVALRGDKDLYDEAIYVFYKANTVYYRNYVYKFQGNYELGLDDFKNLRHLGIDTINCGGLLHDFFILSSQIPTFSGQVANNLETITINIDNCAGLSEVPRLLRTLELHLLELKRISLNLISKPDRYSLDGHLMSMHRRMADLRSNYTLSPVQHEINCLFGVESLRTSTPLPNDAKHEQCVWEAKEGEVLKRSGPEWWHLNKDRHAP